MQFELVLPVVVRTGHRHAAGVGRPDGEARATRAGLGAELAVQIPVGPLAEETDVQLAEGLRHPVRTGAGVG